MVQTLLPNYRSEYAFKNREPYKEWKPQHLGLYRYLPNAYWYYDTPDGQDCMSKMWFCMKAGACLGGVASIYDVLMFTKPIGYANVAFRIAHGWFFSSMATGATYSASVCTSLDLRKKDDKVNHLFGGLIAGSVWGAARGCFVQGSVMSGLLALVGMYIKDCKEYNRDILPNEPNKEWGFWLTFPEFDFTITADETFDDRTSDACYRNTKWAFTCPTADLS